MSYESKESKSYLLSHGFAYKWSSWPWLTNLAAANCAFQFLEFKASLATFLGTNCIASYYIIYVILKDYRAANASITAKPFGIE